FASSALPEVDREIVMFRMLIVSVGLLFIASKLWGNGQLVTWVSTYEVPEITDRPPSSRQSDRVLRRVVTTSTYDMAAGGPWDGSDTLSLMMPGRIALNIFARSPPDLMICVVELAQDAYCQARAVDGGWVAPCVNSQRCDTVVSVPATSAYALVIFDHDSGWLEGTHDYADAVLVSSQSTDVQELKRLENRVRGLIERVSPTAFNFGGNAILKPQIIPINWPERLRRQQALMVLSEQQLATGQALAQSHIQIFAAGKIAQE
ncbi:MAG: hypothetical protein AAFR70_06460, partial [Pseudomonadota bacterium]